MAMLGTTSKWRLIHNFVCKDLHTFSVLYAFALLLKQYISNNLLLFDSKSILLDVCVA